MKKDKIQSGILLTIHKRLLNIVISAGRLTDDKTAQAYAAARKGRITIGKHMYFL